MTGRSIGTAPWRPSVLSPWSLRAWAGDVAQQERVNATSWRYSYAVCIGLALLVALIAMSTVQALFAPATVVVIVGVVLCVTRPTWGVYLAVGLAMLGDASIFPSYPFTKNLSSPESILYLGDGLTLSPVDLFLGSLALGWVLKMLAERTWRLHRGPLFVPVAVFTGFLLIGLVWGLARGGAPIVAYWEIRALLYLPILFVLVTNLLDRPQQYRRLLWLIMVILTANALAALREYYSLSPGEREALESLGEHGAAVHAAALIVFTAATWLLQERSSASGRWLLLLMAVPVIWAFLLSERRAAMVALFGGLALVMVVLRWHSRRRFWMILPVVLLALGAYLGAFWNASGVPGFPAQAVKTVVAPDQQSAEDQASDLYRKIERHDINATIRSNPVMGVGFGQPFHMPWPLPNISFFVFWEYITHNSILWIWMKAGIGGFVAMLLMFATTLRAGARALLTAEDGRTKVVTLTSVAYVLMFAIFAYVDIAWDTRNVVLLAVCMAQIDRAGSRRIASPPEPPPRRRERVAAETETPRRPVAVAV
jgi:O-antigen ligase